MMNRNQLVLGVLGAGMSRFFVKPNLMQRNTLFDVTVADNRDNAKNKSVKLLADKFSKLKEYFVMAGEKR